MGLNPFLDKLSSILQPNQLLRQSQDCQEYGSDWTKTKGEAMAVVLPRSTAEVQAILKLCSQHQIAVVPSGGRTGLAGGAVAARAELALSLAKMTALSPVNLPGRSVTVQAGATTQAVHEHAAECGLTWPIDLASKGSATIGGNLSTNAGGVRVIRHGMARKWVTGIQAVTMQGTILELNQDLEKNNTGYDLVQLLVGSEGTLAVITAATLKLTRLPRQVVVALLAVKDLPAMIELFVSARQQPFDILAFEFFSSRCLKVVKQKLNRESRLSIESPYYVLVEIEGENASTLQVNAEGWLEKGLAADLVLDGQIGQSSEERKAIWGLREGITESIALSGEVRKYDISVPVKKLAALVKSVEKVIAQSKPGFDLYLFGHLGDGSPHFNLLKHPTQTSEQFKRDADAFENELFPILEDHGGSISAEHGIGLLKKNWVKYSRSPEELSLFRAIKLAFDPLNLLNPGKIFDL